MNMEPGESFHAFSSSQGETALSLWCKSAFSSLLPLSNLGGRQNEGKKDDIYQGEKITNPSWLSGVKSEGTYSSPLASTPAGWEE